MRGRRCLDERGEVLQPFGLGGTRERLKIDALVGDEAKPSEKVERFGMGST